MFTKRTFANRSRIPWVAMLVLAMVLTACGGGAAPDTSTTTTTNVGAISYIARLDNAPDSARIGIVVEDGKFAVYICSLDDAFNLVGARWYSGEVGANGAVSGVSPDGVTFEGTVSGNQFTGVVTGAKGKLWKFSGSSIPAGGPAGLYRGIGTYGGQEVVVGAVVDPDGTFASTVQVRGKIEFVTPVAGAPLRVDNTNIKVTIGSPSQQIPVLLVTTLKGVELF